MIARDKGDTGNLPDWFHRSWKMAARNKNTYLTSNIFK
jgi:hypothetical protein